MYWNCLSSLAVFPMSRQITHYYNHSANQTTCFEDQIAICAESGFGTFSCRLFHIGIIKWLMKPSSNKSNHSHFSLLSSCVSSGFALHVYVGMSLHEMLFFCVYPCRVNTNVRMFTIKAWSSSSVTSHLKHVCGDPGRAMHLPHCFKMSLT